MTKDRIRKMAEYYGACLLGYESRKYKSDKKINFSFNDKGGREAVFGHLQFMIGEIKVFLEQDRIEKALRWLGFIQGCLWMAGVCSIDQLREHNRS